MKIKMMKKLLVSLILAVLIIFQSLAQNSIFGKIYLKADNSPLPGANVFIKNNFSGVVSGKDGSYFLGNLKAATYTIEVSFIGYETIEKQIIVSGNKNMDFYLEEVAVLQDEVIISATKAGHHTPGTFSLLKHAEIAKLNSGQDIPFVLDQTPSVVVSSDAGTGIGYTGIRIRGTDITRINVTVNGIPMNDPESHGVWFVNMPDFISSVDNVQVQRGVGTSVNGAAAFGATVNFQTETLKKTAYTEFSSKMGSYNTFIEHLKAGTGLINDKFPLDVRLSKLNSDGYIDRSFSDLKSFFVSGGYYSKNHILRFNVFSGKEKTYQAWWGVPKVRLENDLAGMQEYLDNWLFTSEEYQHMLDSDPRTYNYYTYENETDNYQQDHYQLLYSTKLNSNLTANMAFHLTFGKGFYEQYKKNDDFASYGLTDFIMGTDTFSSTDLIRQKWLDNTFYGATWSLNYNKNLLNLIFGGGWNRYDGDHSGRIIWSEIGGEDIRNFQWYFNNGIKTDLNVFLKAYYLLSDIISLYGDAQVRRIDYTISGHHDDLRDIGMNKNYLFFNPRFGAIARINSRQQAYVSMAIANREPSRSVFRDAAANDNPLPERLFDYEAGYSFALNKARFHCNLFYMDYLNQLVMTGQINDVGAVILRNVPKSYRAGIEFIADMDFTKWLSWHVNTAFSKNKVMNFTEYVDDWDNGGQISNFLGTTDLSFSPAVIINSNISIVAVDNLEFNLITKYVSRQFIDNASNPDMSIDPFFVNNLALSYSFKTTLVPEISLGVRINNLFSEEYETFAWTYRYYYSGEYHVMDGYFPQATRNYMGSLTIRF